MKRADGECRAGEGAWLLKKRWRAQLKKADALVFCNVAFLAVAMEAERLSNGKSPECDLSPKGELARLARSVAKYADRRPPESDAGEAWLDTPDPFAELAGMIEALREVAKMGDGAERMAAAIRVALRCALCRGVALAEADAIFDHCKANDETAKVKGSKAAFRNWKRAAKSERNGVRVLGVRNLLGGAGWTVEQVAKEAGVSVRTVARLARQARALGVLEKRTPGRRKSVDTMKGGRGGESDIALKDAEGAAEE